MHKTFDVCVIGSANLDLVAQTARIPTPGETVLGTEYAEHAGGKGLNQAVGASRSGARTCFIGAVGDDEAGRRLKGVLNSEGIDSSRVETVAGVPTGRAVILVDETGENSIVVVPGANSAVTNRGAPPESQVILAQLEIPLATVADVFAEAKANGSTTVLNPAPAAPLPSSLVRNCTYIIPNEHEVALLGGEQALLDAGCEAVIVTLGSTGARIVARSGTLHVKSFAVDTIDTTGAGDAFCGALSSRLASGYGLHDAARWAAAAGALATTVEGAVPAQPTATAIANLLAGEPPAD